MPWHVNIQRYKIHASATEARPITSGGRGKLQQPLFQPFTWQSAGQQASNRYREAGALVALQRS